MNARDRKAPAAIAERFAWLGQPAQLEDALAADLADALAADQDVLNRGGENVHNDFELRRCPSQRGI